MKRFICIILSICFLLTTTVVYAAIPSDIVTMRLGASYVKQDKDNWCWAASAENLVIWEMNPTRTQWDAVKYIKGWVLNWYPDTTGSIYDSAYAARYISNNTKNFSASETCKSYEFIREQIYNSNPVIVGAGRYSSGVRVGGHATLIIGWSKLNGKNYITYFDSALNDDLECTYEAFCDGTFNGRRYDQTCYVVGD